MKRIYFLVPDVQTANAIVNELLVARVEERHMHILAKRGTPLEELPEATMMQKSDFIPAVQRGLAFGGTAGALAGLVAVTFAPAAAVLAGGVVLASALGGAGMGAWISGMIGLSVGNSRVKQFEEAIAGGQLLMMVDVPTKRVEDIKEMVRTHHPEAEFGGTEPHIPAFP